MSTHFRLSEKVTAFAVFDGRLEKFGVREHVKPDETTAQRRCLTDGHHYLWVDIDDGGLVRGLTRYGFNAPRKILKAIAEELDTDIFSEHQPQYWGFDTQEEWDAVMDKMAKESEEKFYVSVINYVRGQPNDIQPETSGAIKADIAKKLIEEDATLLAQENKDQLMRKIESIYERDSTIKNLLSPEKEAFITFLEMMATSQMSDE